MYIKKLMNKNPNDSPLFINFFNRTNQIEIWCYPNVSQSDFTVAKGQGSVEAVR